MVFKVTMLNDIKCVENRRGLWTKLWDIITFRYCENADEPVKGTRGVARAMEAAREGMYPGNLVNDSKSRKDQLHQIPLTVPMK